MSVGRSWPVDSRPVWVDQNWVVRRRPPWVSVQQESTFVGSWGGQERRGFSDFVLNLIVGRGV